LPYEARLVVELAKADLARRAEIPVSEISVISVEAVDWPDTSLGCPEPGMAYAQVITPGYLIVLEAKGQTFEYHSDEGRFMVLCAVQGTRTVPLIPVNPDDIQDGDPWMPVHQSASQHKNESPPFSERAPFYPVGAAASSCSRTSHGDTDHGT